MPWRSDKFLRLRIFVYFAVTAGVTAMGQCAMDHGNTGIAGIAFMLGLVSLWVIGAVERPSIRNTRLVRQETNPHG